MQEKKGRTMATFLVIRRYSALTVGQPFTDLAFGQPSNTYDNAMYLRHCMEQIDMSQSVRRFISSCIDT